MKCKYCGSAVEPGFLYCPRCGHEFRIVPDYNPLDDVLEAHIRSGVDDATRAGYSAAQMNPRYSQEQQYSQGQQYSQRQQYSQGQQYSQRRQYSQGQQRPQGQQERQKTGQTGIYTRNLTPQEIEAKRQAARRKKQERMRKKRQQRRILILCMAAVFALFCFIIYKFSYTGIVNSGQSALNKGAYTKAEEKFKKAIAKKESKAKAYEGLADVYLALDKEAEAEELFLDALKGQTDNAPLYKAFFEFYLSTKQQEKISPIVSEIKSKEVLGELSAYVVAAPEFGLTEEKYDDVQQLKLISKGNTIYYTTDGKDATASSTEYKEPIQIGVGETKISAVSVNKKGIPSLAENKTYTVELPIADAPSVTPSTGQYDSQMKIEIVVPEGYTAYYTMDNTDPTASSTLYTGPIDMPSGNTIFCAVLADKSGRLTEITKRNYEMTGDDGSYDSDDSDEEDY